MSIVMVFNYYSQLNCLKLRLNYSMNLKTTHSLISIKYIHIFYLIFSKNVHIDFIEIKNLLQYPSLLFINAIEVK